ncbi:DNA polymerase IV [Sinorhizobium meliloti]|nr:DNA polymerase IV [Sinorhizobium meliloti]RVI92001.1 DNA polymerase IV [Sinorhizobium meliloti]
MPPFQITRSKTVAAPLQTIGDLEEVVGLLLAPILPPRRGIRLLGVSLSSLERQTLQTEPQLRLAL